MSDELSPTDSGYGNTIGIGSNQYTQAADNSGNTYVPLTSTTMTPDLRYALSGDAGGANDPVGNSSLSNYTPTGTMSDLSSLSKFLADNKGLVLGGGALAGLMGASDTKYGKTGYQGTIPRLGAARTMITAPPTRAQGYRPGAGGIDYGGDVSYARMPDGTDPWAGLSGTSGSAANANLTTVKGATGVDTVKGATGVDTVTGGTKVDTVTGGTKVDTVTGGGKTDTVNTNLGSAAYQSAITQGLTPMQYYNNINQWILDNPYASRATIDLEMARIGVSNEDLQKALSMSNFSDATKYGLTNGMGLQEMNFNIRDWVAKNPYATNQQIQEIQKASGVSDEDVARALTATNASAGKEYAIIHDMGLDTLYKNILDFQRAGHTDQEIADAMDQYGISNADVKAAQDFSKTTGYAEGGMAKGRYLQGETDGMADKLPAQIGESQPAALSHGEFVIPADVVSHMGNGNSDAGAKKLYQMMDKIRMARTGTKQQGKKINPDKFMPGGLASSKYAQGGAVQHFLTGGSTGTSGVGTAVNAGVSGVESNLSNWAGDYVTNMLGQGQALANMPYTAYQGPLTAGESGLQTQAFNTAGNLTTPSSIGQAATTAGNIGTAAQGLSYTPTTTSFGTTQAQQYMNPYLQASLNPQLEEARRQSQITQQQNAAKLTGAGAFGGSRQAIMDAETQRNLGTNLANITGQGYNTAYGNAMSQFNADQQRKMQEAQYGAGYGLQGLQTGLQAAQAQGALGTQENQAGINNLNAQLTAGAQQRGIESEGIAADKAQFEEARANPYKMVQYQQSLLQGLPLAAQSYNMTQPSTLTNIGSGITTANDLLNVLMGNAPAKPA